MPDVTIQKVGGDYVVVLNEEGIPRLRVNSLYRSLLRRSGDEAKQYVEQKLRSAVWLIKSVEQRQRTLRKVAQSLVNFQRDFLDKGLPYLRPLALRDVGDDIGMHESTISRVTTNKYVQTPQGLFELKFFFHSGIASGNGAMVSSVSVKKMIQDMVAKRGRGQAASPTRRSPRRSRDRASPSRGARSPSTARSSASCPRTSAGCVQEALRGRPRPHAGDHQRPRCRAVSRTYKDASRGKLAKLEPLLPALVETRRSSEGEAPPHRGPDPGRTAPDLPQPGDRRRPRGGGRRALWTRCAARCARRRTAAAAAPPAPSGQS